MPSITTARASGITIGGLSRQTRVNVETIRYYERIGIIPAPPRTAGGQRVYGTSHARTLAFIRRARELGFGIGEIRTLLTLSEPGRSTCAEVRRIASQHLETIRAKQADLKRLEAILAETVERCVSEPSPACPVLDLLGSSKAF